MAWRRGDEKASLCTVVKTRETSHPGSPSSEADETWGEPLTRASSLASRPQSHRSKGVWERRTAGCTSAAGPRPTPHPRLCRDPAPVAWPPPEELLCLSTSEGDGNGCVSRRLSGEGEVGDRHAPPGNAPRYLRRHRVTRIMTRSVQTGSMAQAGDQGRVREA